MAWATEHHINHFAFTSKSEEEEAIEELSRTDMPLYLLKFHVWRDIKALFFGWKYVEDGDRSSSDDYKPSFLSLTKEEQEIATEAIRAKIQKHVTVDINRDREAAREIKRDLEAAREDAAREDAGKVDKVDKEETDKEETDKSEPTPIKTGPAIWEELRSTNNPDAYKKATRAALVRRNTRVDAATRASLMRKNTRVDEPRSAGYE